MNALSSINSFKISKQQVPGQEGTATTSKHYGMLFKDPVQTTGEQRDPYLHKKKDCCSLTHHQGYPIYLGSYIFTSAALIWKSCCSFWDEGTSRIFPLNSMSILKRPISWKKAKSLLATGGTVKNNFKTKHWVNLSKDIFQEIDLGHLKCEVYILHQNTIRSQIKGKQFFFLETL